MIYTWESQANRMVQEDRKTREGSQTNLEAEVRALRGQVDRLTLACQSMWELIRDAGNFSEEELDSKITEIDLRDGSLDGKLRSSIIKCRSCSRNTNSRRAACVWCGGEVEREHVFEG